MMAVSLLRKRLLKDKMTKSFMFILTVLSLLVLVFMGVGLYMKSRMILNEHSLWDLLTNADWKPLSEEFGFLPFIIGTLAVTALSILIALPISLLSAIYLSEYAHSWTKRVIFPVLDILAGIPSVVFGVWGT